MRTTFVADELLDHTFRATGWTAPTSVSAMLLETVTDMEAGTVLEATYTGYAAPVCEFDAPQAALGGRQIDNTNQESFGQKTDAGSITGIAVGIEDQLSNLLEVAFIDADAPAIATAATNDTFTAPAHGLSTDQTVRLDTIPGGTFPTGVSENVTYYIRSDVATDTFSLWSAAGSGGTMDITVAGACLVMPFTGVTVNQNDTPQIAAAALKITW